VVTADTVIGTALRIADEEGLDALSMRRLAREIGVTAMAIYRHVDTREALLDAIAARALDIDAVDLDPDGPWSQRLFVLMCEIRRAFSRHPGAAAIATSQSIPGPGMDRIRERILELLTEGGLTASERLLWLSALSSFTLGYIVIERTRAAPEEETHRVLSLPANAYPHLIEVAHQYGSGLATGEVFETGLARLIAGLAGAGSARP